MNVRWQQCYQRDNFLKRDAFYSFITEVHLNLPYSTRLKVSLFSYTKTFKLIKYAENPMPMGFVL